MIKIAIYTPYLAAQGRQQPLDAFLLGVLNGLAQPVFTATIICTICRQDLDRMKATDTAFAD